VPSAITHPEKLLFPADGITKGDVCAYYQAVAEVMVPHLAGRPVTMERYPAGIDKKGFIQKDVSKGFPDWLHRVEISKRTGGERAGAERTGREDDATVHYPLVDEARALLWLANQNAITPHVWPSRLPKLQHPDLCVFDLDPSEDASQDAARDQPAELRAAALAVRDLLAELGLPSFVKTSGSKGFHIVVALDGEADFEPVRRFSQGAGAVLVKRHPALFTEEFIKADRGGRIFVDTGRNGYGATFAAVYALRPKPGAPVSAPCTWAEIERGAVGPQTFTLRTLAARLAAVGDLWRALHDRPHSLRDATAALERLLTDADWQESHAATTRRPVSRKRTRR
jgi:bifunctional non-homologous end joining protein LigD